MHPSMLKALLHCAIFSATCLARVENVALQVAEIWCWGPVTLCNFLSNLSRNALRNEKREMCACTLVKTAVKLRDKLLEGDTLCNSIVNCCNPLRKVELSSTSCNAPRNKKLRDNPCYTEQFFSNLSHNGIARQVAERIAQCNRSFIILMFNLWLVLHRRQEWAPVLLNSTPRS